MEKSLSIYSEESPCHLKGAQNILALPQKIFLLNINVRLKKKSLSIHKKPPSSDKNLTLMF